MGYLGPAMRLDAIELDEMTVPEGTHRELSPLDVESALLALSGESVVDWTGLRFRTAEEVNSFLRLWHCDVTRHDWARERLRYLYNQAVNYLEEHVGLTFPHEVRRPKDVREAFLRASMRERFSRERIRYCAILKLIHVINHLEMQELRSQSPVREVDLIDLANAAVLNAAARMRLEGFPLHAFYGNRKTRPSVITKLLAKREATAATIFDKLRFRVVTERREDIVPALAWLTRNLIPFPAITPGQSHNNLLSRAEIGRVLRRLPEPPVADSPGVTPTDNPSSGQDYRVINFIADLPVCIYEIEGLRPPKWRALLGEAVTVSVEFQLVDAATEAANETGDNRHERYKERQMVRVYQRLGRTHRRMSG
jgi:uncharacterized protein (TIGR04552 family)